MRDYTLSNKKIAELELRRRIIVNRMQPFALLVIKRDRTAHRLSPPIFVHQHTGKVVFSRRKGESKHIALVTDDLRASMKRIVADYVPLWSVGPFWTFFSNGMNHKDISL